MSSAVRKQPLRVGAEVPSVFRSVVSHVQGERPAALLASRAFWLGGLVSVGAWSVLALALIHAF